MVKIVVFLNDYKHQKDRIIKTMVLLKFQDKI
jgi:hypothetical protein